MKNVDKDAGTGPKVLVATDNADDADQMLRLLRPDFPQVRGSTQPEKAIDDFAAAKPDVLVLAFDTLEKSQLYYLGLYRVGGAVHAHQTVLLCGKEQVKQAFALCKKAYFDDYVLYWPHSHDGNRLQMSVLAASRQAARSQPQVASSAELMVHAKHLQEIERVVATPLSPTTSAQELVSRLGPSVAGTRSFARAVQSVRPLVLIVDDDPFARKLMQQALDPARWDVALASDGMDALTQLRRLRPDIILVDVQMPGMSGIELTARLKQSDGLATVPIVMITGNACRETLAGSIDAGAASFLVKPVSAAALMAKLDRIIPR